MIVYLGTSLVVAALTDESATERVQDWLAAQEAGTLAISAWVRTEFASALSVKLRMGQVGWPTEMPLGPRSRECKRTIC